MGFLVCGGSPTQCSFGMTPSVLNVTPENKVLGNAPIACMNDNIVMKNIMPFGMCMSLSNPMVAAATAAALGVLTPQPCLPVIAAPWAPPLPKVLIGSTPAISMDSQLMCSYGGIIKLISPVQTNIMAN